MYFYLHVTCVLHVHIGMVDWLDADADKFIWDCRGDEFKTSSSWTANGPHRGLLAETNRM